MKNPVPQVPHYAVITYKTIQHWVEGDERSRTHPGHGYPAGYETREEIGYQAFETVEKLQDFIKYDRYLKEGSYQVIKVEPMKVETKVSVIVK